MKDKKKRNIYVAHIIHSTFISAFFEELKRYMEGEKEEVK